MPLSLAVLLSLFGAAAVRGQSALDGFDPNANFFVRVVVAQPDGKILIGGEFTSFSPNGGTAVARNRIARLNPDGSLDTFDPNVGGTVNTAVNVIVVQPDGKILIGGDFTTLAPNGGATVTRNHIALLNPDGSFDTNFNPNASAVISAITVQADGKILVGGSFTSIGGQTRNGIARLDATNGSADAFNPNASGGFPPTTVNAIVVQADGRILAGGSFTSIGGQIRNRIARLDSTTGLADSFNPNATAIGGSVQEIAVQPDGKILVGGAFTAIGGQPRSCIARLDPATGAADAFNPNADNTVHAMALQPDGKVLIGGDFSVVGGVTNFLARLDPVTGAPEAGYASGLNERVFSIAVQADGKIVAGGIFTSIGGQTRNRIARLQSDGTLDRTLNLGLVGNAVFATAVQPDGKVLIGGVFTTVQGVGRQNMARLNEDGSLDTAFNPSPGGQVTAIALQADGKIFVGGKFGTIGGQTRLYLARLDAMTGAPDSFNPNTTGVNSGGVYSLALQADGKIVVGGAFAAIGGQTRNHIARLDGATGLADSFNPFANNSVFTLAVQADGNILAGGAFTVIGGQTRNRIARLDAMTGRADSFNPNADGPVGSMQLGVDAIVLQADGKILVGGRFFMIGGQTRYCIARLDAVTGLADSFNPGAINNVTSISPQADGKVLVSGLFDTDFGGNSIGGQPRNHIARLDGTSGLPDSFDPNANEAVYGIAVQADGKILAGGWFSTIGGQARGGFARLGNDTVAWQNLTVLQNSIDWTRGGSSPQFTRVTFESSSNNVNYTLVGNGTFHGTNWTLTGLSLATGQNLYIRARGYYRSGYLNGSESIQESVRNVFLTPELKILSITRAANGHILLQCLGVPNQVNNLQVSPDLSLGSFAPIVPPPVAADNTGAFPYDDAGAVGLTRRFYRLAFP